MWPLDGSSTLGSEPGWLVPPLQHQGSHPRYCSVQKSQPGRPDLRILEKVSWKETYGRGMVKNPGFGVLQVCIESLIHAQAMRHGQAVLPSAALSFSSVQWTQEPG